MLKSVTTLLLVPLAMSLVGCSAELDEIRRLTPYTDREVEAFIERFPALSEFDDDRPPEDVLQRLGIDITALKAGARGVGGCICFAVYELSPSYELVVDDNACSGHNVYIRSK